VQTARNACLSAKFFGALLVGAIRRPRFVTLYKKRAFLSFLPCRFCEYALKIEGAGMR